MEIIPTLEIQRDEVKAGKWIDAMNALKAIFTSINTSFEMKPEVCSCKRGIVSDAPYGYDYDAPDDEKFRCDVCETELPEVCSICQKEIMVHCSCGCDSIACLKHACSYCKSWSDNDHDAYYRYPSSCGREECDMVACNECEGSKKWFWCEECEEQYCEDHYERETCQDSDCLKEGPISYCLTCVSKEGFVDKLETCHRCQKCFCSIRFSSGYKEEYKKKNNEEFSTCFEKHMHICQKQKKKKKL